MAIGLKIRDLRMKRGESLQDVADAVGVSKAHVWELEKGRTDNPSITLVKNLADHFGVSIRYLVEEDVEAEDADEDLARMFRQAQELDSHDRQVLDDMLQSFRKRQHGRSGA